MRSRGANRFGNRRITAQDGTPARCLGLAAGPKQDARCVRRAFAGGINYFFFYGPGNVLFIKELALLMRRKREQVIVATGSGSRRVEGLRTGRRKLATLLGVETIDVFFIEYVHSGDDPGLMFGNNGVLDELQKWKVDGLIRFVGATTHDRALARRLAADPRVDVLMHRFNMAHRKAATEVFPAAVKARTPIVAFTATRWGTLLAPCASWSDPLPTAVDCYRFCLAQPAIQVVLTAPRSAAEVRENLKVLESAPMSKQQCRRWEHFGDLVHATGKRAFETN